jgi:hypothetical protein
MDFTRNPIDFLKNFIRSPMDSLRFPMGSIRNPIDPLNNFLRISMDVTSLLVRNKVVGPSGFDHP